MPQAQCKNTFKCRIGALGLMAAIAVTAFLPAMTVLGQVARQNQVGSPRLLVSSMGTVFCRSGGELAAAFADTVVQLAYLTANIVMTDVDWEHYETPITLWRNVTVSGMNADANTWPLLDLGFTLNRVRLGPGVALTFTHVAIRNWRKGAHFQAPGLDLVATNPDTVPGSGSGAAPGLVLLQSADVIQRTCLPNSIAPISVGSLVRPPQLPPGDQSTSRLPANPNCTNDTSAPAVRRCWAAVGTYWDLGAYGMNFDELNRPVSAGYNLWFFNCNYKCETRLTEECVANLTAIPCFYQLFPWEASPLHASASASASSSLARSAGQSAGGGGGGGRSSLLAPLLGGLLGGLALVGLAVGVTLLVWRRVRGGGQGGGGPPGAKPSLGFDGCEVKAAAQWESASDGRNPNNGGGAAPPSSSARRLQAPACAAAAYPRSSDKVIGGAGGVGLSVKLPEAAALAGTVCSSGPGHLPISTSHEAVSVSLCGPDPDPDVYPGPTSSNMSPAPGLADSGGPAAGGSGGREGGLGLGATPAGCRFWSQTGMRSERSGGSSSLLPQLRCTTDELALLPVTPMTPLQPAVNLDARAVGAAVKLLPVTLGKGSFGRVVEGQYGGERVAVKLLNAGLLTGVQEAGALSAMAGGQQGGPGGEPSLHGPARRAWRALVQEVEVLARCHHPNIVRLLAASLVPPRVCLVMELMDTSLDRLLHGVEGRSLDLGTVLHIALQIARALSYLHPTVLHRDLKPANVLISQPYSDKPLAKLADFGLSRLQTTVHATKNTEVGTAPYVAPESFDVLNPAMSDRAEIYAFGVILWEMLTGKRPWQGSSTAQIAYAVSMLNSRLPLRDLSEGRCPHKVRALMVGCWEKDPARRPAAAELVKALVLAQEALVAPTCTVYGSEGPPSSTDTHIPT
ncbi:hypothetical protein PLESTF_001932700 [Pleodorina starrii]|nr:hypothetical protein PLESTF_001932700 [Pleodorina starrii]